MAGKQVELVFHQAQVPEMTPYERLLGDALRGDSMLFVRENSHPRRQSGSSTHVYRFASDGTM
jgi:glucose-6-phosphate 1-dehydrogenase